MTDTLRTRIQAIVLAHSSCECGEDAGMCSEHAYRLADAVIRELEADYILVPKGHTIARIRSAEKLGLTGDGE